MNNGPEEVFLPDSGTDQRPAMFQRPASRTVTAPAVNLENVEDFSKVCRVCATITEMVMPIFSGEGLRIGLADKITRHLPIQVRATDQLPLVMCYQCASTLLATHELAQCSLQADAALRTAQERRIQKEAAERREADANAPEPADNLVFNAIVKKVLVNYYHTLNMDEGEDWQFECQKCSWRGVTAETLAGHLRAHRASSAIAAANFIRQHITFEQTLLPDRKPAPTPSPPPSPPAPPSPALPAHCCPFCESVFSSPARLALHLAEHVEISAESAVDCCGTVFHLREEFVKHALAAHARAPPPGPACRACGLRAAGPAELRRHVGAAHADRAVARRRRTHAERAAPTKDLKYIPTTCADCGKTFSNKYNMAVHARAHREGEAERFKCSQCPRSYASRGALVSHARVAHGGLLRFACTSCGERFANRSERAKHEALHTGELPHRCTFQGCPAAFRARNSLLRHLDAHRDVRPYVCHCGKAFRRGSHLNAHLKTHRAKETTTTKKQRTDDTTDQNPGDS